MKPNAKWALGGLALGVAVALMLPTFAQESPSPQTGSTDRTVSTTGVAIVRSAPDEALIGLGVTTDADTAQQAMDENAAHMNDVIAALLDAGLDRSDLATSSISLYPRWDDSGTTVIGFTAQNDITATVRDLDRVGALIDRGIEAGANVMNGVTFQLSSSNRGADQALGAAVADARRKAELLAAAAGADLGSVVSVTEVSSASTPPILYARDAMAAGPTPVLPPTLETQVSVSVVWSLV
jgi:uncharacterized protein YggE